MTGEFSCIVNFNTDKISDFRVDVSGNGHSASINGASGSFSSSQFEIDANTGTWKVDTATYGTSDDKKAYGSLYGPNGQHIGGVWGMINSDYKDGVPGIFQGTR